MICTHYFKVKEKENLPKLKGRQLEKIKTMKRHMYKYLRHTCKTFNFFHFFIIFLIITKHLQNKHVMKKIRSCTILERNFTSTEFQKQGSSI